MVPMRTLPQKEASMQMEKPNTNTPPTPSVPSMPPSGSCQPNQGTLPGTCAPMVFPFVAMQEENPVRYSRMEALQTGTLFPGLDLPFKAAHPGQDENGQHRPGGADGPGLCH